MILPKNLKELGKNKFAGIRLLFQIFITFHIMALAYARLHNAYSDEKEPSPETAKFIFLTLKDFVENKAEKTFEAFDEDLKADLFSHFIQEVAANVIVVKQEKRESRTTANKIN